MRTNLRRTGDVINDLREMKRHFRETVVLAAPVALSQISDMVTVIADTIMVGRVGTIPLAAATLANSVWVVGFFFTLGFTIAITPIAGAAWGRRDHVAVGRAIRAGWTVSMTSACVMTAILIAIAFVLPWFGAPADVTEQAFPYFLWIVASIPPRIAFGVFKQSAEAMSNTRSALIVAVIANLSNIGLNWVLIYGHLGFPAMGLEGAGIATFISRLIMVALAWWIWSTSSLFYSVRPHTRGVLRQREIHRATIIPGESGDIHRASIIPGESRDIHRASTIPGESGDIHRASIIPGESGDIHRASTIPGESGDIHRASTIPGESSDTHRESEGTHRESEGGLHRVMFMTGYPIAAQIVLEILAFAGGAVMMGWLGASSLAAHQIAMNLAGLSFMAALGISAAATIRTSNFLGAHRYVDVTRSGMVALYLVVAYNLVTALLFVAFRHVLPTLYSDDPAVIDLAGHLLLLAAAFQLFDGSQNVGLGALRGIGDVRIPMMIAVVSYGLINIPVSYVCAFILDMGPQGIWIGYVAGLLFASVSYWIRFRYMSERLHQRSVPSDEHAT